MNDIYRKLRADLSKLKFIMGLNPRVQRPDADYRNYIPKPYKAVCLISADFEMAWASRYTKSVENPLQKAIEDGYRTRRNVPKILDLCDQYNIPITWATVGHLFLESCEQTNGVKHPEIPRLPYFENKFWKFDKGDWFDYDPCTDYKTDPAWYAPDLIRDILGRKTIHEIGCHTFSHVDCRDIIDNGTVFEAEIVRCRDIAQEWGLELKSFVHPGHTIGNLDTLAKHGFTSIRTDYGDSLSLPIKHGCGLWELKNTAELAYRPDWTIQYHIHRFKKIIDRAIKYNRVCVFWFHPSFSCLVADDIFPGIMQYLHYKRADIYSTTHTEYCRYLER